MPTIPDCKERCPEIRSAHIFVFYNYVHFGDGAADSDMYNRHSALVNSSVLCAGPREELQTVDLHFKWLREKLGMATTKEAVKLVCCNPLLESINRDPLSVL